MCEKCAEIDGKLGRYVRWQRAITDAEFIQRVQELIDELARQRLLLHPDPEE